MSSNKNIVFSDAELTAIYSMVAYEIDDLNRELNDPSISADKKKHLNSSIKTCKKIKSKLEKHGKFTFIDD
ncbi:hypothetical protein CLPUN_16300 [Clostridium puniceum]|uniref:Uncharacterized protein n=1 Tax=Clostridium puniceum TaxID=29367 RepID=A0A1S8TP00_9CLOT|nr:hypothetical protein [Clostridium puniceum]OOM79406.1 hypothetical protein CLPUN_16300 [Clostridium puniceum]